MSASQNGSSLYPKLRDGTLVRLRDIHYPYLPAVNFTLAGVATQKFYLDRGPHFNVEDISGVMREPPIKRGSYPVRQPQVDQDGNTIAGLPSTAMLVPIMRPPTLVAKLPPVPRK